MVDEIQLKVENAYPIDFGRGIIRLDPTALLKLQLAPGDIAEINGEKKNCGKSMESRQARLGKRIGKN